MKKLLLVSAAVAISASSFAQSSFKNDNVTFNGTMQPKAAVVSNKIDMNNVVAAKSTGVSDTFLFGFLPAAFEEQIFDSAVFYILGSFPADSGAFFGPNAQEFNGFAEWFNPGTFLADTTMEIVGAFSLWGGNTLPASTKTISYKMWNVDMMTQTPIDSDNYLIEMPGTSMLTETVNITTLKIDTAYTIQLFATATPVTGPFFLGYEPNFTFAQSAGDTIGLYSSRNGYDWFHGAMDTVQNTGGDIDTLYFAQTCFRIGSTWQDVYASNILAANLSIVPIYRFEGGNVFPADVKNVNSKLALYGNYPNPATDKININFGLGTSSEVKVQIMDITGRIISTNNYGKMNAGANTVSVNTSALASGSYVYMITSDNGGVTAAQFTVAK